MAVYDDQKTNNQPDAPLVDSDDKLRDSTGIGKQHEAAMTGSGRIGAAKDKLFNRKGKDGALSPEALKAKEAKKAGKNGGETTEESTGLGKRLKNRFFGTTKRKAASSAGAGGAIGLLVGAGFFYTGLGPLQFIHASQLLSSFHFTAQDNASDHRSAKFIVYALSGRAAKGRLGVIQNSIADKMETRLNTQSGLRSIYSPGTQRLIGYEVLDRNKAANFLGELQGDGLRGDTTFEGFDIDGNRRTVTGVNFGENGYKTKRAVTRVAVKAANIRGTTGAIAKWLLIKRGGVNFHPMVYKIRDKADSTAAKWDQDQREARAKEINEGPNGPSPVREDLLSKREKIKVGLNAAKGPLIAVIGTCTVKSFGESIELQNLANQQTLVRMGMSAVTTGDQVKWGKDFSLDQLGALNAEFYDAKNGGSWVNDPGIQQENGQEPTGRDYASEAKPGAQKPLIFQFFDYIPEPWYSALNTACKGVDFSSEAISKIPGVELLNSAIAGFFHLIGLNSPEEYVEMAKNYFATGIPDALARGPLKGGYWNIGTRLAANDAWRGGGARELSNAEAAKVKQLAYDERKQNLAEANFYDKYLNLKTSTSLLSSVALQVPSNASQLATAISSFPARVSNLALMVAGGRTAQAAVPPYDYGFPLYGFSEEEQNDPDFDNPFSNEDYMLEGDRLDRMNKEYGKECFNMQVGRDGSLDYGESGDFTKIPAKCSSPDKELLHYRFYLTDIINANAMACYYDEEASCGQLDGSATTTTGTTTPATGTPGDSQTLAKEILALNQAGKIVLAPSALADITAVSNGQLVTPGEIGGAGAGTTGCSARTPTTIDSRLLQAAVAIASKYTYQIQDFVSGHNCDTGRHPLGRAFDIFELNGQPITWNGPNAAAEREFATYAIDVLAALLPDGSQAGGNMGGVGVGTPDCLANPLAHPSNINYFVDACDELHLDVGFPPK